MKIVLENSEPMEGVVLPLEIKGETPSATSPLEIAQKFEGCDFFELDPFAKSVAWVLVQDKILWIGVGGILWMK